MSARLAAAWSQESLIPRGREGYRKWRSGEASGARVVATSRSHSPEVQATASRILGTLAFPSYLGGTGTVYGRVSTLAEDTGGWEVAETAHPDCPDCVSGIFGAIATAAATGSREGGRAQERVEHDDDGVRRVVSRHMVTVRRVQ